MASLVSLNVPQSGQLDLVPEGSKGRDEGEGGREAKVKNLTLSF